MRIPAVLAVVLVGLGLAADAAVAAPPPLRAFPAQHGRAYPVTDGLRYFVIDREPGVVRVVDTRTGEGTDAVLDAIFQHLAAEQPRENEDEEWSPL